MRNMVLACTIAVMMFGCSFQPHPSPVTSPKPAPAAPTDVTTYQLQISFLGLIAFAQDPDTHTLWALLVKAHPDLTDETTLPPGVKQEIDSRISSASKYPAHLAWIRFKNADIVPDMSSLKVENTDLGISIEGKDLTFATTTPGPTLSGDLSRISNADTAIKAMKSDEAQKTEFRALDILDLALIAPDMDQRRLSARASIGSGKIKALPSTDCGELTFSYHFKGDDEKECRDAPGGNAPLAEQVSVTQDVKLDDLIKITLAPGDTLTVKPKNNTLPVVIEVVNQVADVIKDPTNTLCKMDHYPSYRWFYRLLPDASKVANPIYPCPKTGLSGGAKCPPKTFVIKKPA